MGFLKSSIVSALLLGQASAADLPSIVMKGTKFFYENGTQFYIKGVAYQSDSTASGATTSSTTFIDPLSSQANCARDVPYLQKAGTNVIRTYAIDPTADHTDCMSLLQDAGIYVISDLSEPALSIDRSNPVWDTELYARYTAVVDEMSKYSNVIGFFAGNEVTNNASNTAASAYVKAAVRDTKAYIAKNVDRWMGVGYAANDDATIRDNIAHYFNCGNQSQAIDFWGYNIYEWCGENTIAGSGYQSVLDFFANYSVPVFFAEYGCNTDGGAAGRIFEETTAIYSSEMTDVLSGGIVYMYFEETNDYGLVSVDGTSVSTLADYNSLSSRIAAATPSVVQSASYTPTNSAASCPALSSTWEANGDNLPPTPDSGLCECMVSSLSCVPSAGLNSTAYGDIFGFICGADSSACSGITANTTTGVYGSYIMCNSTQQLAYVLDSYYRNQNEDSTACDFEGQAVVTKAAVASSCSASLASASSENAVAATATVATTDGASASSSSSSAAVAMLPRGMLTAGDFAIGAYVLFAMAVGGMMVAL